MSERDLQRIDVLAEVIAGRRTVVAAAAVLALSVRQVHRLLQAYRRGDHPQGPGPSVEQPDPGWCAGLRDRAGALDLS